MAIKTQPATEMHDNTEPCEEVTILQSILATQGQTLNYDEAAVLGNELLGFFEAIGVDCDEEAQSDA